MSLFLVTANGQIYLVRAGSADAAEALVRRRMGGYRLNVGVQELKADGPEGVVVKLVPREPAAGEGG